MKPLLSIGMIFKNEMRCLERCMKSLEPLRKAVPCELVMADTGSSDGSREVAEKYADTLFDFPWEDDFSAARNAVMDRCSGEWFMTIDADEWLDEDIGQLLDFLRSKERTEPAGGLTIRNYVYHDQDKIYTDFLGIRLLRMSTGLRYTGRIHEHWDFLDGRKLLVYPASRTILHHDGYIMLNDDSLEGREKMRRNMALLQKELEEFPESLKILGQCIESCGKNYEDHLPYIRRGIGLIQERRGDWADNGANLLRHAVHTALKLGLPEFGEWLALAEELFPESVNTTVDIQFDATEHAWRDMDCPEIIFRGERYISNVQNYRLGRVNANEMLKNPPINASFHNETTLRIFMAQAYVYESRPEKALEALSVLDHDTMDEDQAKALLETLLRVHTLSGVDTALLFLRIWDRIGQPQPSQEAADQRRRSFIMGALPQFSLDCIKDETARMNGEVSLDGIGQMRPEEWNVFSKLTPRRHGYTLFKPLCGKVEIGTAAVMMDEADPEKLRELLGSVERLDEFPIQALTRALLRGVEFPDRILNIEEMDSLAVRLTQDKESLRILAERAASEDFAGSWQTLLWTRGLLLTAVKTCEWKDPVQDMILARAFAKVERAFLTAYYAPEVLREGNICALPMMHRAGWYCAQAFDALESGDAAMYARYLREGLASCPDMKPMVEFLAKHTPELQPPPPSPELLALAEQVRTMLAAYDPNDPAVAAIKASPVYQRVAYLIEGSGV